MGVWEYGDKEYGQIIAHVHADMGVDMDWYGNMGSMGIWRYGDIGFGDMEKWDIIHAWVSVYYTRIGCEDMGE